MKRFFSFILAVVMVFSLAACSSGDVAETGGKNNAVNSENAQSGNKNNSENTEQNTTGNTQNNKNETVSNNNSATQNNTSGSGETGSTNTQNTDKAEGSQGADNNLPQSSTPTDSKPDQSALNAYENVKKLFSDKEFATVTGTSSDPNNHIIKLTDSGVRVRYASFKGLKEGEPVNIMQVTDLHFNKLNDRDIQENNPAIADTRKYRKGFRDESTVPAAQRSISLHTYFDAVAITGDNIDYLTWGSLDLIKQYVWDVIPKVLMPLGGHDTVRVMQGYVADNTTLESRYDILQSAWKHDIHYSSMIIKDRVMMIQINNGQSKYYGDQYEKLSADIKKAKDENLAVFIFQHEPISTRNTEEMRKMPVGSNDRNKVKNFYKDCIGGSKSGSDATTKKVYDLIVGSADVVKGVFCGHFHEDYYTEIKGYYEKNGEKIESIIPQVILSCNSNENGAIFAITVEQ